MFSCIPAIFVDAQPFSSARFGQGMGAIVLDDLMCNGTESRLIDCANAGLTMHNCDHSEDASVRCQIQRKS